MPKDLNLKSLWLPVDHPCLGFMARHDAHGRLACNKCGRPLVQVEPGRLFHPDTPALTAWLTGQHPDQQ